MTIYIQTQGALRDYEKFEGMTLDQIAGMMTVRGLPYVVKTRAEWETASPQGHAVYVMAGQSNMLFMSQQQGATFLTDMGDEHSSFVGCAVGSTAMSRWMVGGDLYANMIAVTNAEKVARIAPWMAGLLFWQGESDVAEGSVSIEAWPARFTAMVAGFRTAMNDPQRRVVFAQITDTGGTDRDRMRTLQAGISIPYVTMVPTDGIFHNGDHTDAAGYAIMEKRFVAAMQAMQ